MEALQNKQIGALQAQSETPIAYATPKGEASLSVEVSSAAQLRARNLSRLASLSAANTSKAATAELVPSSSSGQPTIASTEASNTEANATHSEGDGHGHGDDDKSASSADGSAHDASSHADGHQGAHPEDSLTEDELKEVQELSLRDMEVRAHEQAHKSAAGSHGGSISLTFRKGPDGKRYAVEGEVPVDMSAVKGDPEATVAKMEQIHRAALPPPNHPPRTDAWRREPLRRRRKLAKRSRKKQRTTRSKGAWHHRSHTGSRWPFR